jgi:hypothetical protein
MGIIWPWERKKVQRELDSVENMLEATFKPVAARPTYITSLRQRLVGKPGPLAKASLGTLELLLLISGAIIGVFVFIFTVIRSIIGVGAGIKLIQGRVGRNKKKKLAEEPAVAKKKAR